jgi:RNA polymerase sigma factor (sigma-70 family)
MTAHPLQDFIRRLCRARSVTEDGHLTDAQLLERFATGRDEAAFEVLVWRHGPLVLNVARRMVRRPDDAEDVFQATFLTLARKAAAIRRGTSVGSWLYKVAYRIALRVRQATDRRARREQSGVENVAVAAPGERDETESAAVLADEVSRLPERYRAAVVLCYLQGSTTEEAARVLGCPRGTVLSRLAWARHRLSNRLIRRGLAPAIAAAAVSFGETASAMPSAALVAAVIRAALPFAAGRAAVPAVSPQVAALARGALQMMLWNKIKIAAVVMCVLGLSGAGAGWLTRGRAVAEAAPPVAEKPPEQGLPRAAEPDRQQELRKEIDLIRARLEDLTAVEERAAQRLSEQMISERLRLVELQDELRIRQQNGQLEDEEKQAGFKEAARRICDLEEMLRKLDKSFDKSNEDGNKRVEGVKKVLQKERETFENERNIFLKHQIERIKALRPLRGEVYQVEETLRRMETHQARQREELAEQRQALRTRLQQLEEISLRIEPADRLRDLERKLDALRRDVNELRRAVERQGGDPRKKP